MACRLIAATFLALAVAVSAAPTGQPDTTALSPSGAASPPICTWDSDKGQYTCPDSALKPNETSSGVASRTLARRYASGICGWHLTLELNCEQDTVNHGTDWWQVTYATIKTVTDGNRNTFITTDGKKHRLTEDDEDPWHISGDGFNLYVAKIDWTKNEHVLFRAYHGGPGDFANQCAFASNKPTRDGDCGNCYVGDFTRPLIDCRKTKRPLKRWRDMDCYTFC